MKYLVIVYDGMADRPLDALGGKTPMQVAKKPILDELAHTAEMGLVLNVPHGMVPESDTANLAILSYDPRQYSKGRAPLEALSMGLTMSDRDVAYRANLVALSEGDVYEDRLMLDHSADEITTEEARILIRYLHEQLGDQYKRFFCGISYRHCLLWDGGVEQINFDRPHDIIGQPIRSHLPQGEEGLPFLDMMKKSCMLLESHPLNIERKKKGKLPANSLWFWSPGKKPALPSFFEKWGKKSTVISAVDLIRGIGRCAGMDTPLVDGATGTVDTNYEGKASTAISAFENGSEFVFVHLEGPDECGHRGEIHNKIRAIECIDSLVLSPLLAYLRECGEDFAILALPDHPTPLSTRTHAPDPVPYLLYRNNMDCEGVDTFTEDTAKATGRYIPDGTELLAKLFSLD